jgi:Holliday junction resolvase RusA-like endonuclease
MLKIQLPYKAISTNKLYLGAKVVSPEYKRFKRDVGLYLVANYPKPVDLKGNLVMTLEVGLSSSLADGSNTVKGIEDSLAEHFKFNDKQIVTTHIEKYLVDKGSEYMLVTLRKTRKNIDRRTNGKTKA